MPVVTYNSYTLPNVFGPYSFVEDEKTFSFQCNFLIQSESSLVSLCQSAETALTEKNKDLSVSLGASSEFSFSHSGNTGYSARPHLSAIPNELSTGKSRAYTFSVLLELPFTQAGYNYRREADFTITYSATRQRIVNFSLFYTSSSGSTAIANYQTTGKTWAESILASLGGNYELVSEHLSQEQERKTVTAKLSYKEILSNQKQGSTDYSKLVDPQAQYSVSFQEQVGVQQTVGIQCVPRTTISISYHTGIRNDEISVDGDIEDVYQAQVKPYLISQAYSVLGLDNYSQSGRKYIVLDEKKTVSVYNRTVSGVLTFAAYRSATDIITLSESINIQDEPNITEQKLWDGNPHTYNMYSTGAKRSATRIVTVARLGKHPEPPKKELPLYTLKDGGSWISSRPQSTRYTVEKWGIGTSGSGLNTVDVYFAYFVDQFLYVVPRAGGGQ